MAIVLSVCHVVLWLLYCLSVMLSYGYCLSVLKLYNTLTNDWCPIDQVLILPGAELTYQVGAESFTGVRLSILPPLFSFLPPLVSFLPVSLCTVHPLITDAQTGQKKNNIQVHSATSYLIFQYLQYWYNQYFPVSAILV